MYETLCSYVANNLYNLEKDLLQVRPFFLKKYDFTIHF